MIAVISPSTVSGVIQSPASKSSMQRACAAAVLSVGTSVIKNPGHSNDDKAAIKMIQDLGAKVEILQDGSLKVTSNGIHPVSQQVNCGESGLGIRMFAPIIALSDKIINIDGEGSLLKRPMNFFDEVFPQLGVKIESNNGFLPINIQGPLKPVNISIDGSLSSQFLTGLLMSFSAADASDITLTVNNLKSRPYIDLTLDVMKQFGMKLPVNNNYASFYFPVSASPQINNDREYTVEGDWSGGAFLLVAGAVAGNLEVKGLDIASVQADKAILKALEDSGTGIRYNDGISIHRKANQPFVFDAEDCPDLFPPLVALAAHCKGLSRIKGVHRLTHKESNRAQTLQEEFGKMGIKTWFENDEMFIEGGGEIKGGSVHSHHDHRIAMACAVAGLSANSDVIIHEADAINKSYPDFYTDLQKIGASVKTDHQA